jgi:addiction module HigA family antidote
MTTFPPDNLLAIHPGKILADDLKILDMSARKFSKHIGVAHNAAHCLITGKRSVTAEMALRLGRAFGTTPNYWLNLQTQYDLKKALVATEAVEKIEPLVRPRPPAATPYDPIQVSTQFT